MNYLTYEEYQNLGGNLIPQNEFEKISRTVSRKVDGLTFNRIVGGLTNLTQFQKDRLQESMFEFCEFEYENADILNSVISNYNLNGVSISFDNSQAVVKINGVIVSNTGYQILKQTGLTCLLL